MSAIQIQPIGQIQSPYKQKFAIPRQPRLVPSAKAKLILAPDFNHLDFVRGLEEFSHIWVLFRFHETADKGYSALVRPPRLGGNERKGVFATRATFRPNGIGMSAVELLGVGQEKGQVYLQLGGIDLLDGTPVVDIKPYIAYSDALDDTRAGFADCAPCTQMTVSFSEQAAQFVANCDPSLNLEQFITQVLQQDPRPAYKKNKDGIQSYGMTLYDFNIRWQVDGEHNHVEEITAL